MRNDLVDACLFASLFETLDIFGIDRLAALPRGLRVKKANVFASMLCAVFAIAS